MMAIKERTKKNFFPANQLLEETAKHRDTLLYPSVVQTWELIRRYISESDKLNWGTEPERRALMREVLAAAEDCEIGTTLRSADSWAALVAFMNMPEKKQDECMKKLMVYNMATFSESIIPTPKMCDDTSYDEEKKGYQSGRIRRLREAARQSRLSQRPKESALFSDQKPPRHANLGCYTCGEFGHSRVNARWTQTPSVARRGTRRDM